MVGHREPRRYELVGARDKADLTALVSALARATSEGLTHARWPGYFRDVASTRRPARASFGAQKSSEVRCWIATAQSRRRLPSIEILVQIRTHFLPSEGSSTLAGEGS